MARPLCCNGRDDLPRDAGCATRSATGSRRGDRGVVTVVGTASPWLDVPGLEVAMRFHPFGGGTELGGDFYDLVHLGQPGAPDGCWAVVIGEARGRGPETAAVAESARLAVRASAVSERSPAGMLRSLNDVLLESNRRQPGLDGSRGDPIDPSFCTAAIAVIELVDRTAQITLATAGHPPPLVLRRHGAVEVVASEGTLLGILTEPAVEDQTLVLGPGDTLVLYTDGITERHAESQLFDEDELLAVVARCAGFTADVLAERIETAARAFVDEVPRDDLTIGVVRVPEAMATATLVSADLPADVTAPGRARRIVAASLATRGLEELLEPAVLLASEVVTNAVVHGGGHARLGVEHDRRRIRVSVRDASNARPRRLDLGLEATSGRGVQLLDQLATRWGVDLHLPRGKTVWFELDAPET
jgi:anti-sigma regulatory factor (Ser/Thr protein kinase)